MPEFPPVGRSSTPRPFTRNWLEQDAQNAAVGLQGELLALEFEAARLHSEGQRVLANRIEHVSQTRGDGLGYDIVSFETNGRERLIEVKTTRWSKFTPFFASANEVDRSHELRHQYHIYRVFNFARRPRLFTLRGAIVDTCQLTPSVYRVVANGSPAQR